MQPLNGGAGVRVTFKSEMQPYVHGSAECFVDEVFARLAVFADVDHPFYAKIARGGEQSGQPFELAYTILALWRMEIQLRMQIIHDVTQNVHKQASPLMKNALPRIGSDLQILMARNAVNAIEKIICKIEPLMAWPDFPDILVQAEDWVVHELLAPADSDIAYVQSLGWSFANDFIWLRQAPMISAVLQMCGINQTGLDSPFMDPENYVNDDQTRRDTLIAGLRDVHLRDRFLQAVDTRLKANRRMMDAMNKLFTQLQAPVHCSRTAEVAA